MAAAKAPSEVDSELHRLLLQATPENQVGRKTIVHLAEVMQVSKATIWYWIKKDFLPPDRASQLVELSRGTVTLDDLHRFVYPK